MIIIIIIIIIIIRRRRRRIVIIIYSLPSDIEEKTSAEGSHEYIELSSCTTAVFVKWHCYMLSSSFYQSLHFWAFQAILRFSDLQAFSPVSSFVGSKFTSVSYWEMH